MQPSSSLTQKTAMPSESMLRCISMRSVSPAIRFSNRLTERKFQGEKPYIYFYSKQIRTVPATRVADYPQSVVL